MNNFPTPNGSDSCSVLLITGYPSAAISTPETETALCVCVLYRACLSTGHCGPRVVVVAKESLLSAFPFSGCGKPKGKEAEKKS